MTDDLHLESLNATATNVSLPIGLTVDEITVVTSYVNAGFDPFSLDLKSPASITARVSAENIAKVLEKKSPGGLKGFVVTIEEGLLIVETTAKVIIEVRVATSCTLRIAEESQLYIDLKHVSVPGPMARNMIEQHLAKVNPVFDLKTFAPTIKLDSVEAEKGFVTLKGRADWPHSR